MNLAWAKRLLGWTSGEKHPDTHRTIFYNVWGQDRVRRVLLGRCRICDFVISSDEKAIKELAFKCNNRGCDCQKYLGPVAHRVCCLCYDMWHALYANYQLKDMNYFRNLDEKDKKDGDDTKRRDRMGL